MVNTYCTLTCDHCRRYLKDANQIVIELGWLGPLLAAAEERGWLLEWEAGGQRTAEDEPARSLCSDCAKRETPSPG